MRVGSLVRARHWDEKAIGIVVSIRNQQICKVLLVRNHDYRFDQLIRDLEIICE
ncbi:MAG: hypothetical protein GOVbin1807_15 [Prokaryotic dsDNA virus sp.]|nr:MAG: hypothetical protein GOVbin1807_15 [Prokaryotic dsDNA virus sp.]